MRRRTPAGPTPRSVRPPGIGKPPAGEWLLIGAMFLLVGSQVDGWVAWLLRVLGALVVVGFMVLRTRYRMRRGEGVWLWRRI